jgi:hypothetical protein
MEQTTGISRIDEINKELETAVAGSDKQLALIYELEELQQNAANAPVVPPTTPAPATAAPIKTHWKKLKNPDYLGSYDFQPGEERTVTVRKVVVESVKNTDGAAGDCTVVHFMEPYKPFILNSTNGKTLTNLFDSPYIEDWPGKSFVLCVKNIKAFGEVVDALRVKNQRVAKKLPVLSLGTKLFENSKKRYDKEQDKPALLKKIKEAYQVSPEVEAALTMPNE